MKPPRLQKYLESKQKKPVQVQSQQPGKTVKRKVAKKPESENVIIIDMPEVKDIPGQENIRPPRMREMEDITISSPGEEGEGLLDDLNKEDEDEQLLDETANVSETEKKLLRQSDRPVTAETIDRNKLSLDKTDGEDKLNETGNPEDMGQDLDIPGADEDDSDEEIGGEDEENNSYSRPD